MKQHTFFVTGTDTDVGKTICCKALLQSANRQQLTTLAYKPIAAGCQLTQQGLRNQDAITLQTHSSIKLAYEAINPIAFEPPIAPHIAADILAQPIDVNLITSGLHKLQAQAAEIILVEGAGGWRLPINNTQMLSDWVISQRLPVILVVGMKLGCLNHALLTYQAIINDGLEVVGWIANQLQSDMPFYTENVAFLSENIKAPKIAEIPYIDNVDSKDLANFVNFSFT
ncbi:dethiobiotin synthase [Psychromonas sp. MME2]|uniref:dethiobiotin synthase n=1 Tax=unclassified Psychromonas TaxID=2614957 RepID=UPI00339C1F1D